MWLKEKLNFKNRLHGNFYQNRCFRKNLATLNDFLGHTSFNIVGTISLS